MLAFLLITCLQLTKKMLTTSAETTDLLASAEREKVTYYTLSQQFTSKPFSVSTAQTAVTGFSKSAKTPRPKIY